MPELQECQNLGDFDSRSKNWYTKRKFDLIHCRWSEPFKRHLHRGALAVISKADVNTTSSGCPCININYIPLNLSITHFTLPHQSSVHQTHPHTKLTHIPNSFIQTQNVHTIVERWHVLLLPLGQSKRRETSRPGRRNRRYQNIRLSARIRLKRKINNFPR